MIDPKRTRSDIDKPSGLKQKHKPESVHEKGTDVQDVVSPEVAYTNALNSSKKPINPTDILTLQQTIGNQAVQRLLNNKKQQELTARSQSMSMIQTRLTVSQPSDIYEQEADRVPQVVTREINSQAQIQEEELVQAKVADSLQLQEEKMQTKLQKQEDMEEEEEPVQMKVSGLQRQVEEANRDELKRNEDQTTTYRNGNYDIRKKSVVWGSVKMPRGQNPFASREITRTSYPIISRVFKDLGRTGRANIHWGGGGGGLNHWVDWKWNAPEIKSANPANEGEEAQAWVESQGTVELSRKYIGANFGDNGTYHFSNKATTRIDVHEQGHTDISIKNHDNLIVPLETRIAKHKGQANAMKSGKTASEAKTALENYIKWESTEQSFRNVEDQQNKVMGAWDTTELAAADYVEDRLAGKVEDKNYAHLIRQKGEP